MKSYHGTILFVTHDRMLVKNIATKIIDIKDGKITVFDGSYEAYEEWLENKTKSNNDDQLLLIETKISEVSSTIFVIFVQSILKRSAPDLASSDTLFPN